jgi:hypothetical protein
MKRAWIPDYASFCIPEDFNVKDQAMIMSKQKIKNKKI